jgi:Holliday junction resolvase-like predicted endonuclease
MGEEMAVEFLRKTAIHLQTNYTFQKQKLIFLKENTLAVVEVKTLFFGFGLPQDFVKPKKSSFLLKLLMPL